MIKSSLVRDKTVYVVGLGKTGNMSIESLLLSGAKIIAWDDTQATREVSQKLPGIMELAPPDELSKKEIDYIFISPGIPADHSAFKLAEARKIPVISDMDLLYLACPQSQYIAVTGTNGKSTTTALIGHILKLAGRKVEVGGNIGTPVLALSPLGADGIYVLETSSFQLDLLSQAKFNIAVFLNLTPDHLDRHGTMAEYLKAKSKIFAHHGPDNIAVISLDYAELKDLAKSLPSKVLTFSNSQVAKVYMIDRVLHDTINQLDFSLADLVSLPGKHNEENIAAAYLACLSVGIAPNEIIKGIRSFEGLPHRLQNIGTLAGNTFINDSKATNAEAAENALLCYNDIIWIIGGIAKSGGIELLTKHFGRVKKTFLIGRDQAELERTLAVAGADYKKCGTLADALKAIKSEKLQGTVLLSPACASYDQFKNFEHRGEEFCRLVKEIFYGKSA
jgi:UDP-N-acetylmuramoylalanine--D-glutamate ligase